MTAQLQLDLTARPADIDDLEEEPGPKPTRGQLRELPGTTWEDIFK